MSPNYSPVVPWPAVLMRGFCRCCPRCGKGALFRGYLSPQQEYSVCRLSFEELKSDDGPAYVTVGCVCLFVVPFFFILQVIYDPPFDLALLISLPLTLLIILGLLPLVKGTFMAIMWKIMVK